MPAQRKKKKSPQRKTKQASGKRGAKARELELLKRRQRRREEEAEAREARAIDAWKKLSRSKQLALLREIVETRGDELKRAFANVKAVTLGQGTRRMTSEEKARRGPADKRTRLVKPLPGLTFVVTEKWNKRKKRDDDAIPSHIYAYATVNRKRRLCAVPTDVRPAAHYEVPAQAQYAFVTRGQEHDPSVFGAVNCAVKLPYERKDRIFALSCRHVFGMTAHEQFPVVGAWVRVGSKHGATCASVSAYYGVLLPGEFFSFDACLAEVTDQVQFAQVRPTLKLSGYITKPEDVPEDIVIKTPERDIPANVTNIWYGALNPDAVRIAYDGIAGFVYHEVLVESEAALPTKGGYSGSPVVNQAQDIFVGMHIAGVGHTAFMIPAYYLLRTDHYLDLADMYPGKRLRLQ